MYLSVSGTGDISVHTWAVLYQPKGGMSCQRGFRFTLLGQRVQIEVMPLWFFIPSVMHHSFCFSLRNKDIETVNESH